MTWGWQAGKLGGREAWRIGCPAAENNLKHLCQQTSYLPGLHVSIIQLRAPRSAQRPTLDLIFLFSSFTASQPASFPALCIQHRVSSIQYQVTSCQHPASSIEHQVSSIEYRASNPINSINPINSNPAVHLNYLLNLVKNCLKNRPKDGSIRKIPIEETAFIIQWWPVI